MLLDYLFVAMGGALGSVARFWLGGFVGNLAGETFPFGTLFVNVTGSFAIGFIAAMTGPEGRWVAVPTLRTFVAVGLCGGYTTFSAFSLQTLALIQTRQWAHAGWNVLASVALCLVGVWLGSLLGSAFHQRVH